MEDEAGFPGVPDTDANLDKAYWDAAREEGGKPWTAFDIEAIEGLGFLEACDNWCKPGGHEEAITRFCNSCNLADAKATCATAAAEFIEECWEVEGKNEDFGAENSGGKAGPGWIQFA